MQTIINIRVVDQTLQLSNSPTIASGGQNETKIRFNFCSLWDGMAKVAVFYREEDKVYHMIVDENNECYVPNEVLVNEGTFFFGVYGTSGTTRRTTEVVSYKVVIGAFLEGEEPAEPTQDIYEQILDVYANVMAKYEETKEEYEAMQTEGVNLARNVNEKIGNLPLSQIFQDYASDGKYLRTGIVRKAQVAVYASEDTTKGTIEERLTAMGFKQGVIGVDSGIADEVKADYQEVNNTLTKQGKLAICNYEYASSSGSIDLFGGGSTLDFFLPSGFFPKNDTQIVVIMRMISTTFNGDYVQAITLEAGEEVFTLTKPEGAIMVTSVKILNSGWEVEVSSSGGSSTPTTPTKTATIYFHEVAGDAEQLTIEYEEGMTWKQWFTSQYNTLEGRVYADSGYVYVDGYNLYNDSTWDMIMEDNTIGDIGIGQNYLATQ